MSENWYKTAKIAEKLYRDASMSETTKEWLPAGLMSALLAVLMGMLTVQTAARANHVSEKDLASALNNKELVSKVKALSEKEMEVQNKEWDKPEWGNPMSLKYKPVTKPNPQIKQKTLTTIPQVNMDKIIDVLLQQENLEYGQTPFRITNPEMKRWKNIMGFPINKNPNAPLNRQKFLYLKNPAHVPLAVKKLFENYTNNPSHYGLDENPSLGEALKVFDQSNVNSKISYLKSQIPGIDINKPLKSFTL